MEIKKSQVRESIMHLKGSKKFFDYVWEHIQQHTKAYKNPRVNYLLDAFLYDGKRIKFDENYSSLEEKILFALIKYIRQKKISSN
ncbi:hypothetical protein [Heyndrickxia sporothermodurans]|uniref:hypothetical protein n=1 Tax=Heyndrickxia sporothermodurans TaxID=46224 RepID=UPI002E1D1960|nr:hypothetical protein [Heyndrickxia sporothermodurans]MED3696818.1 hypothetical protein [Heyndrickxia sporothermodurans]